MVDARNSYLAADLMRFGGANQTALWHAFATTGLGVDAAAAPGADDGQPTPSFASPNESNATITFNATAPNEGNAAVNNAKIYVGEYEARVTPSRHGNGSASHGCREVRARDVRLRRAGARLRPLPVHEDVHGRPDGRRSTVAMPTNWASSSKGATAVERRHEIPANLIDDTENTPWDDLDTAPVAGQRSRSSWRPRTRSAACR